MTTVQRLWQRLAALAEWQSLTALGAIAFITGLHYGTAVDRAAFHDLYRRLYYIPVIYGAVRYGAVGGVLLSVTVGFMYIPHLIALLVGHPDRWVDNVADLVLLLVVGILTGALVDALCRRERLAAIGSHASRLVHDVRSPMSAISAGARMMARPDLDDEAREEMAEEMTDAAFFWRISEGVEDEDMPAWKEKLNEEDRWQLVNFVRTFAPAEAEAAESKEAPSAEPEDEHGEHEH